MIPAESFNDAPHEQVTFHGLLAPCLGTAAHRRPSFLLGAYERLLLPYPLMNRMRFYLTPPAFLDIRYSVAPMALCGVG